MDMENIAIIKSKSENKTHIPQLLTNGDSQKQKLTTSRYLLYKSREKWTINQQERAKILFELYPELKQRTIYLKQLRSIYNINNDKNPAMLKLAYWYLKVENSGFKNFNIVLNTITVNYQSIVNYFENKSTNTSGESFNTKKKRLEVSLEE